MSYDKNYVTSRNFQYAVSIPLEQGSVLRLYIFSQNNVTRASQSLWNRAVSYDLLQKIKNLSLLNVSIPLEQGSVLRQNYQILSVTDKKSQSLWNRAVSYDKPSVSDIRMLRMSQSLWNRAVSYDLGHFLRKRTF